MALHLLRALDILREQSPPQLPHIRVTRLLTFCLQIGPYFDGGPRVIGSDRVAFQSLFERPDGRLKKDCGNLGWNVLENTFVRLGKLDGANEDELEGENDEDVGKDDDCLGNLTGLCSVPYQIICHLWSRPFPGRGVLSGPMFITSKLHVPTADSPKKCTERKGHSSNLEPNVSLGRGKRRVEREPAGDVRTSIMLPLGM